MPRDDWSKYGKNWNYYKPRSPNYNSINSNCTARSLKYKLDFGPYRGRAFENTPRWYLEELVKGTLVSDIRKQEIYQVFDKWDGI